MNERELRLALQNSSVERGVKQFEAVYNVIVSMMAGVNVTSLFAEMLKVFTPSVLFDLVNLFFCAVSLQAVETNDIRQKKLIYMYLCNFSRENQDLSTLAVNTLQKDFRHSNPLVRAAALKAMASLQYVVVELSNSIRAHTNIQTAFSLSIRVRVAFGSIDHAQFTRPLLNSACVDSNPHVRKALVSACLQIARDSTTSKENKGNNVCVAVAMYLCALTRFRLEALVAMISSLLGDIDSTVVLDCVLALNELSTTSSTTSTSSSQNVVSK